MKKPNYNNYSVKELREALSGIDHYSYPERVEELKILLEKRLREFPEEEVLESKYAGFGVRLLAFILDALIFSFLMLTALFISTGFEPFSYRISNHPLYEPVTHLLAVSYYVVYWNLSGKTPGNSVFGLIIVNEKTGKPPTLGRSFVRYFGYFVSGAFLFLGFLWAIWHPKKRTWHDILAGTVVVIEYQHNKEES